MEKAKCPLCEAQISVPVKKIGYEFSCPECNERIVVKQINPLILDLALEDYEEENTKFEKM
ncbi:MAG: hypothetical protein ABDH37_02395 [Candidatus Hydrothermales bacterium]